MAIVLIMFIPSKLYFTTFSHRYKYLVAVLDKPNILECVTNLTAFNFIEIKM